LWTNKSDIADSLGKDMQAVKDTKGQRSMTMVDELIWVDDDQYLLTLGELCFKSFDLQVFPVRVAEDVEKSVKERSSAKVVILDLMMPPGHFHELNSMAGFRTGLLLANQIKSQRPDLTVIFYTAYSPSGIEPEIDRKRYRVFSKTDLSIKDLAHEVRLIIDGENRKPESFIAHGHDTDLIFELKDYLQNTLNFPDPVVLREQAKRGRTIIEAFEESVRLVDLVFILLTPDDIAAPSADPDNQKSRARQNVIFEMGYFYGVWRRKRGRVILLQKGDCELPSNISGITPIDVSNGVEAAGEKIRKEVIAALNW
jgi:predicted nucleotide-binding protein